MILEASQAAEAPIWHWWIGVFLSVGAISAIIMVVIGYIVKVEKPRYPKRP